MYHPCPCFSGHIYPRLANCGLARAHSAGQTQKRRALNGLHRVHDGCRRERGPKRPAKSPTLRPPVIRQKVARKAATLRQRDGGKSKSCASECQNPHLVWFPSDSAVAGKFVEDCLLIVALALCRLEGHCDSSIRQSFNRAHVDILVLLTCLEHPVV